MTTRDASGTIGWLGEALKVPVLGCCKYQKRLNLAQIRKAFGFQPRKFALSTMLVEIKNWQPCV